MEKQLIGRGMLSGAAAGLAAFIFARLFAEPLIQRAIDYETARDAAQQALDRAAGIAAPAGDPEIFSRTVQADLGMGAALILFGAAMGALVAVAYVVAIGRVGRIGARTLGLLVPGFGFVGVFLVPFAKYPANPPAIGREETIGTRGALYLITVFVSCLFLFLAVYVGQRLHRRYSAWTTSILMGAAYLAAMGIVFAVLPHETETPLPLTDPQGAIVFPGFPADLLAQFRFYAILAQVVLWGGIALSFAPRAEKLVDPDAAARHRRPQAATVAA